jgi:uncharacterized protein (TIGR02757 family)
MEWSLNNNDDFDQLKSFLDLKFEEYNRLEFIESDPILIPKNFDKKQDIEISGLLIATIAWGQRKAIIKNGHKLLELMERSPYDFLMNSSYSEIEKTAPFVHRTFNRSDLVFFLKALKNIYTKFDSLEHALTNDEPLTSAKSIIVKLRDLILETTHQSRVEKHLSNPEKGSSAKRLNMFLRWMVRSDQNEVDFGIWESFDSSILQCPLDVHSGRVARKLGLLNRKQNDWRAVEELTTNLQKFDPEDPVKYDFALFGLGVFEKF